MLTFILKKEWYEKIKSGKKTVEYREVKPYWTNRLNKVFSFVSRNPCSDMSIGEYIQCSLCQVWCELRLGYTKKYLTANITMIKIVDGKNTDLHIDKPVYAIYLRKVEEAA